ncbi:hypothetical protein [Streptomyces sp. NPDC091879]|jgi:hypothetical protein|uniref:hypothetical protein n=1 Tax=Streptomyces sp. NPDC091879 TaxID=3366006 RepID=UPI00380A79EF
MAAVYPHQYKSFTVHKNLVEDIDASHVNNLQDEVVAIQQTLGINPHQDTALKMKTNTWASVATRLDAVQRGKGIPACYLSKSADTVKGDATKVITFARPSAAADPEGLFNGHSITANRSGWWIVFGRVLWYNAKGSLATGADRQINIAVGGSTIMSQDLPPISDGNSHMHIGWQGWVTAGKAIDLSVYHPLTGKTLSLQSLQLSAAMLREA